MSFFFQPIKSAERHADLGAGEILITKLDYDVDGNIVYRGVNSDAKADDALETWSICKITYDSGNPIQMEYRYKVAWADRAILDWL